jgi:hypothetical protein
MQTNNSGWRILGTIALGLLLQSCGGPKSSSTGGTAGGPVPTSRMFLYLTVEAGDASTAVVRANLNDGDLFGESFRLDGGDFLRACASGVCRNMADNDSVFTPDYIARLNYQPGVDYVVNFDRRGAIDAPSSRVALPPPFSIVTPANHQQVTDGDTVMFEWSPTGAPLLGDLNFEADCTHASGPHSNSFGDLQTDTNGDGRESVAIDPIVAFAHVITLPRVTRCTITIIVSHELRGLIDPAFKNGIARGIVSRKIILDYIPR